MDLSTFSEMVDRFTASLTPKERELLEKRFEAPRSAAELQRRAHPSFKRGRGQRKNRRDRAGRVKHEAHLLADALLRAARAGATTNLRLARLG